MEGVDISRNNLRGLTSHEVSIKKQDKKIVVVM